MYAVYVSMCAYRMMYASGSRAAREHADAVVCTKGVANIRRDHDGGGAAGRAAGRVAGHGAAEALPARAPRHLRPGPARVRARHDARHRAHAGVLLRALHPYVYWRSRFESQLGNSSRYVAGKRCLPQGSCWHAFGFTFRMTENRSHSEATRRGVIFYFLLCQ